MWNNLFFCFSFHNLSIYVSAEDYEDQERTIDLLEDMSTAKGFIRSEHFILGGPGFPFYYRGNIKVPFQPLDDLIAVALNADNKNQLPQQQYLNVFDSLLSSVVSSPTYNSTSLSELRTRFVNSPNARSYVTDVFIRITVEAEALQFMKTMEQDDVIVFGFMDVLSEEEKEKRFFFGSLPL